jgi:hypothetical protein
MCSPPGRVTPGPSFEVNKFVQQVRKRAPFLLTARGDLYIQAGEKGMASLVQPWSRRPLKTVVALLCLFFQLNSLHMVISKQLQSSVRNDSMRLSVNLMIVG